MSGAPGSGQPVVREVWRGCGLRVAIVSSCDVANGVVVSHY